MLEFEEHAGFYSFVTDGGPIYHETLPGGTIIEPWNAFSSLALLVPVFFIWLRLRGNYKKNLFLVYWCAPLLLLGGIGSTLYHAFRSSPWLMYLDVLPIVLLTISIGFYFLLKVTSRWWMATAIILISLIIRSIGFSTMSMQTAINFSYLINGAIIFVPAMAYLKQTSFKSLGWLVASVACFALALFFRYFDDFQTQFFPQGTHYLWHACCAIGAMTIGEYLLMTTKTKDNKHTHNS